MKENHTYFVGSIPGRCPSKKNMWHTGRGRIYADSAVNDYTTLAWKYLHKPGQKSIEEEVALTVCFESDDRNDLDNMVSTICDVLQKCKVIKNDRQIRSIYAWRVKVKPKDSETIIVLSPLAEPLDLKYLSKKGRALSTVQE